MRICFESLPGQFKRTDRLFTGYRGKRFQEVIKVIARFEVVDEILEGDTSAHKDWSSTKNVWVTVNDFSA